MTGFFTSPVSRLLSGFKRAVIELVEDDEPPRSPQRALVPPPPASFFIGNESIQPKDVTSDWWNSLRRIDSDKQSSHVLLPTERESTERLIGSRLSAKQSSTDEEREVESFTTEPPRTPPETDLFPGIVRSGSGDTASMLSQATLKSLSVSEEKSCDPLTSLLRKPDSQTPVLSNDSDVTVKNAHEIHSSVDSSLSTEKAKRREYQIGINFNYNEALFRLLPMGGDSLLIPNINLGKFFA